MKYDHQESVFLVELRRRWSDPANIHPMIEPFTVPLLKVSTQGYLSEKGKQLFSFLWRYYRTPLVSFHSPRSDIVFQPVGQLLGMKTASEVFPLLGFLMSC